MGYNGIGMQKWIFTQKSRKPFSRKRKPHHTNIGNTKIEPYTFTPGQLEERHKYRYNFAKTMFFLAMISLGLVITKMWNDHIESETRRMQSYSTYEDDRQREIRLYEATTQNYLSYWIDKGDWEYANEEIKFLRTHYPKNQKTEFQNVLLLCKQAKTRNDTLRAKEMKIRHIIQYPQDSFALKRQTSEIPIMKNMDY